MIDVDLRVGRLPEALDDFGPGDFQAVFSDPPYGLGKLGPGRLRAMLSAWLDGREGTQTAGMLGRAWDVVLGPATWERIRDVTSPGALVFAYSHAKTVHLQTIAMQLGGWQILPQWTRIHGGAMALGQDVSKAIDKAAGAPREVVGSKLGLPGYSAAPGIPNALYGDGIGATGTATGECDITSPATPLARRFDGYNTAVRAVTEPIVSAVNPPSGPWASNAAEHGCGGFNAGEARIPSGPDYASACARAGNRTATVTGGSRSAKHENPFDPRGRFPPNVLLEHAAGCGADWCVEGCPVRVLGEQGGESVARRGERAEEPTGPLYGSTRRSGPDTLSDSGTAARFYYQGRASAQERSAGVEWLTWRKAPNHPDGWLLDGGGDWKALEAAGTLPAGPEYHGNPHLAVKAVDGGSHLATLLRQPDPEARILIPYAGTGSEIIAAMIAGWRRIVAVEMSPQWAEVARRRVAWWRPVIENGARGEALEILREWGTTRGPAPEEPDPQLGLFE